jgi:hypothetical protein
MKHVWLKIPAVALGIALVFSIVAAQRSNTATYDSERQVKLQGSVTRIDWVNPRAFLFVDVTDSSGIVMNWAVDFGNPLELERDGWKKSSVHIGDVVIVEGSPARRQSREALAKTVILTSTGKRLFSPPAARPAAAVPAPTPRWPDGQVRLGPAPGMKGYWGAPSSRVLVENKAPKIPMNEDGLLVNISDADRVAPFQPWAKALYLNRQRNLLKDDPLGRCLPQGGPRQFQMPNGFQFIEQRELGRVMVLLGGGDRNWRVIYTDGRPAVPAAEAVLSYYGTSTGRWDKDTLVVDSAGYSERFWMANGGLPHTEALHLIERFSRPNYDTLKYEVTVDDPRTYTRPWTASWTVQWVPDKEIEEYFCEDNSEHTFIR